MARVWELLERFAAAIGWLLEQLVTLDRIVFLVATIKTRITVEVSDAA